ncbi:hypothetical protein ANN_10898 [Periplaneta americana]|uniref:Uncharacterized protein n=1 Tax=Periplaneta americana TaxID=6978 RepID=A0ABQ8T526_PERAM|nr:hypothetical protein ANN_10898 [Periplaneta americana]
MQWKRPILPVSKKFKMQPSAGKMKLTVFWDSQWQRFSNYGLRDHLRSSRLATLGSSDEFEKDLNVNSVWENIRDSIKIAAEQSIGYYGTKKKKPWFDDCCMVVERRKQTKLKFLQDPVEKNRDNYFNERWEASRTLSNKKRDYLKEKLDEVETNSKNKNIRDLYKGIKEFKNDLLADSHSILNRWKNYLYIGQIEMIRTKYKYKLLSHLYPNPHFHMLSLLIYRSLGYGTTSFDGEIIAISECLRNLLCHISKFKNAVILSDSKAAILSIVSNTHLHLKQQK